MALLTNFILHLIVVVSIAGAQRRLKQLDSGDAIAGIALAIGRTKALRAQRMARKTVSTVSSKKVAVRKRAQALVVDKLDSWS